MLAYTNPSLFFPSKPSALRCLAAAAADLPRSPGLHRLFQFPSSADVASVSGRIGITDPTEVDSGSARLRGGSSGTKVTAKEPKCSRDRESYLVDDVDALPLPMTYPDTSPVTPEVVDQRLRCDPVIEDCKIVVYEWTGKCRSFQGSGYASYYNKRGKQNVCKCVPCQGIDRVLYTIRAVALTEVRSIRRHAQPLGWQYIIIVLATGKITDFRVWIQTCISPPLYFYSGGVKEFLATIKQHVFIMRSAEDTNVFLVNDFQNPLQGSKTHMGGTMRLGSRRTYFNVADCKSAKLYGNVTFVDERHRHRYEVNPDMISQFESAGLSFVGRDETGRRMEIIGLPAHPYFVSAQDFEVLKDTAGNSQEDLA